MVEDWLAFPQCRPFQFYTLLPICM